MTDYAELRARSGRLRGNRHVVEVTKPGSVAPYARRALCGFRPVRYWQPANAYDDTCPACDKILAQDTPRV